jgi:hypothetical protein
MNNAFSARILKIVGYTWSCPPKIKEIVADKHSIHARVPTNVFGINTAIGQAVKRVTLPPWTRQDIAMIDVISTALLATSRSVWLFLKEARVCIVLIKRQCLGYAHGINEVPSSPDFLISAAASEYPIANFCVLSNAWLASC